VIESCRELLEMRETMNKVGFDTDCDQPSDPQTRSRR